MWRALPLIVLLPGVAAAQLIPDRTTLDGILGSEGVLANFEGFTITAGSAINTTAVTLDAFAIVDGQGPGLAPPNVTFFGTFGGNLQWDDANYFGAPSREILFNSSGKSLSFDFGVPATAFGLDIRDFVGYTDIVTVTIYAPDRVSVLGTFGGIVLDTTGVPVFFGYQAAGGIGRVTLSQVNNSWSPLIDNLAFTPIPEPSAWALFLAGIGCWATLRRWRRA